MKRINIVNVIIIFIALMPVVYTGCKEEGRIDHIDSSGTAPAQVTIVDVRNTPGGAVLKYALPIDRNLLYVQATYETQPGVTRETKSSYFKDSLVLQGFGEAKPYEVKIYSVGKNGKASEPLPVTVEPTTPPVYLATKNIRETFGGVSIDIVNPEKANLAVVLLADTANIGYLSELYTFYMASMPRATFNYRGLDTIPYEFGVYLRDRWNNFSDSTIVGGLTPWYEQYIDKSTWSEYPLPGDHQPLNAALTLPRIWDESNTTLDGFHGMETHLLPSILTWDLGRVVRLSRFTFWPRGGLDDIWKRGHPRIFEIWGSLSPNISGALDDSWIPLGRFESLKPSGDGTQITQEDIDFGRAGIEFDFEETDFAPVPQAEVRYIRFVTRATYAYASVSTVSILKISFWGIYTD